MKIVLFLLVYIHLFAHQSSLALLHVEVNDNKIIGSYKLAIRDANILVNLDTNFDSKITWSEVLASTPLLEKKIKDNIMFLQKANSCALHVKSPLVDKLATNSYLHFDFESTCKENIEQLNVTYTMLFDKDLTHKAYMSIRHNALNTSTLFSEDIPSRSIDLSSVSKFDTFVEFIKEGVIHIFIGIDHILFLLALLLPSVLILKDGRWSVNNSFAHTISNVIKVVTAFTLAHSITLSLSILGYISLDSWIIESIIALSVVLAALNNISGVIQGRMWVLVFAFGLIHGMGFASVLNELALTPESKFVALVGFNIGVELGQLCIVLLFVPLIFSLRKQSFYKPLFLYTGSFSIVIMGLIWMAERVGDGLV